MAACVFAACLWLIRTPAGAQPRATVAFVVVATNNSPVKATFRLYNDSRRAIFLSWMVVEAKTQAGWKVLEKVEPGDPRGVGAGKSIDLLVSVPAQAERWRVKMIYGTENRGLALFLTRAELGIKNRSLSGLGSVGVFTGQDSVVAEVSH
ncbi:MAG TPA: hypothetical protein VLT36_18565 [Candidatus Dormibacteraeota bacterium]|nr:hypothetical protein [Candidatus Dormibacteraeota bacterium]